MIRTSGVSGSMSLRCSMLYLAQYRVTSPELLATGGSKRSPTIVGDVFIHRSAKVHPTAKVLLPIAFHNWEYVMFGLL